jgi:hypothetical protein
VTSLSDNSLVVRTYQAKGAAGNVGATFDLLYQHGAKDPATGIHWIQVVNDNHKMGAAHGVLSNIVDSGAGSPYYDADATANSTEFMDMPTKTDGQNGHYWHAELYLVQEIAAKKVMFYAGVNWGWGNGRF